MGDIEKRKEQARKKYWENPEKAREAGRKKYSRNKEARQKSAKIRVLANPDKYFKIKRTSELKRKYNLSLDDYDTMFIIQNGKCALCHQPERIKNNDGSVRQLAVDHDHLTGKIRLLLCHDCNLALGLLKDNIELLDNAKQYLLKYKDNIIKPEEIIEQQNDIIKNITTN